MNPLLQSICDQACADLAGQIQESSDLILASIQKAEVESQLHETPLKFRLSYSMSLDFDKSVMAFKLTWKDAHTRETQHTIEDPLQTKLPLAGVELEVHNQN